MRASPVVDLASHRPSRCILRQEDDTLTALPVGWPLAEGSRITASATAMSCSTVPALAPTGPTMVPSKATGTPPPKMTTFPALLS